jgi:hypothetical protein
MSLKEAARLISVNAAGTNGCLSREEIIRTVASDNDLGQYIYELLAEDEIVLDHHVYHQIGWLVAAAMLAQHQHDEKVFIDILQACRGAKAA